MNKVALQYFFLVVGATLQGLAMSLFLFPHSIPSAGAAGIAILLNYFANLPLGLSLWLGAVRKVSFTDFRSSPFTNLWYKKIVLFCKM